MSGRHHNYSLDDFLWEPEAKTLTLRTNPTYDQIPNTFWVKGKYHSVLFTTQAHDLELRIAIYKILESVYSKDNYPKVDRAIRAAIYYM